MGLERLIRNTYGTTPQIDLDKQILRARVPRPATLDFGALADGIRRANVGTAAIEVEVDFKVTDGRVVIEGSGQSFTLEGSGSGRKRFKVHGWESPESTRLEPIR